MLSGFVHCEFNVCENWNTFMALQGNTGLLSPRTLVSASPLTSQIHTGMGILIPTVGAESDFRSRTKIIIILLTSEKNLERSVVTRNTIYP